MYSYWYHSCYVLILVSFMLCTHYVLILVSCLILSLMYSYWYHSCYVLIMYSYWYHSCYVLIMYSYWYHSCYVLIMYSYWYHVSYYHSCTHHHAIYKYALIRVSSCMYSSCHHTNIPIITNMLTNIVMHVWDTNMSKSYSSIFVPRIQYGGVCTHASHNVTPVRWPSHKNPMQFATSHRSVSQFRRSILQPPSLMLMRAARY